MFMVDFVTNMTSKFKKLDKFEGNDFRRWQKKKIHFPLTTLKVVYVLSTLSLEKWKMRRWNRLRSVVSGKTMIIYAEDTF